MKLCQTLLFLILSLYCYSQSSMKGKNLNLVFKSAYTGYAALRGELNSTQLPDTLYGSLITLEGTTNNYIRTLPSHSYDYFSIIGENMTLGEAKAVAKSWKTILEQQLPKYTLRGEKVSVTTLPESSVIIFKTDGTRTMQIFIMPHRQEDNDRYDAQLYFMFSIGQSSR